MREYPLLLHSRAAWEFLAALRAALFFIRFRIARQRIEIQIQRHQLAEAREDFVFELRREQHAFGIVVIADGDIFRVVPRVQELADVAFGRLNCSPESVKRDLFSLRTSFSSLLGSVSMRRRSLAIVAGEASQ